jgi:hypothetical protein
MGSSCTSWGKRTNRSWAFSRQRESGDGGLQCRLDNGEWRRQGRSMVVRNGDAKMDFSARVGPLL